MFPALQYGRSTLWPHFRWPNQVSFFESGCKITAFFWHDQIFSQKNIKKVHFWAFLAQNRGKNDELLEWIAKKEGEMGRKWAYGTNRVRHYETLYIIRGRAWTKMEEGCETGIACRTHNNGCLSLKIAKRKKWMAFESFLAFYLRISEKSCNFAARKCVGRWKTR
jgi:hypothetical protein